MSYKSQKSARASACVKKYDFMQDRLDKMVSDIAKGNRTICQEELEHAFPQSSGKEGKRRYVR